MNDTIKKALAGTDSRFQKKKNIIIVKIGRTKRGEWTRPNVVAGGRVDDRFKFENSLPIIEVNGRRKERFEFLSARATGRYIFLY